MGIGTTSIVAVAGDKWRLTVSPITFPDGRDTSDFDTWTATIREDNEYPRRTLLDDPLIDPVSEGWEVMGTASGTASSATAVYFDFSDAVMQLLKASVRRYVVDAVGFGGTAGPAAILAANWLKVLPRVTAFT